MKPPFPNRQEFIAAWLALTKAESDTTEYKSNFWAHVHWADLITDHPEVAFSVILEILNMDTSTKVLECLSAGPLEDLLVEHGTSLMSRIEDEAMRSRSFRKLLGGVWKNATRHVVLV